MAAVRACACVFLLFILSICGSSYRSSAQSTDEPTAVGAGIARQDESTEQFHQPAALAPVEKEQATVDDICKQENGSIWTCKNIKDCPKTQQELKQGRLPPTCTAGDDPMVCCEPDVKPSQTAGSKARAMCKQYGEAVYSKIKDPGSDDILKVDNCAAEEPLIIKDASGQEYKNAGPREYPHTALIGHGSKGSIRLMCTGSLISERFVLGTANCADSPDYTPSWVRVGDYNIDSTQDDDTGMARTAEYEIIEIIKHPQYKWPQYYNNIALYKLKTEVEFNKFVRPICLQTEHQFAGTYAISTRFPVIGSVLQKHNLTIIPRKECSDAYTTYKFLPNGIIDASQLCASGDRCQDGIEEPLLLRLQEPYCMDSLVGVSSWRLDCRANRPAVFTRVSHFVPWIESIVWP